MVITYVGLIALGMIAIAVITIGWKRPEWKYALVLMFLTLLALLAGLVTQIPLARHIYWSCALLIAAILTGVSWRLARQQFSEGRE